MRARVQAGDVVFAPIGLCDMYNGGAAVQSCAEFPAARACFTAAVRGAGRFLAYCSRAPVAVFADGVALTHAYEPTTCALTMDLPPTGTAASPLVLVVNM